MSRVQFAYHRLSKETIERTKKDWYEGQIVYAGPVHAVWVIEAKEDVGDGWEFALKPIDPHEVPLSTGGIEELPLRNKVLKGSGFSATATHLGNPLGEWESMVRREGGGPT